MPSRTPTKGAHKDFPRFVRNALSSHEGRKLEALKAFGRWLFGDYRLTWPQLAWWQDEAFTAFLHRFDELDGFNTHRKWTLAQLVRLTVDVPGDTAECGVYQGASSWLICAANRGNRWHERMHHLFDSFEGLSEPGAFDGSHWRKGNLRAGEEVAAKNLAEFERVAFHKGWIPERFPDVSEKTFSFVHLDIDLYQPTRDSVAFFYDRLSPGGVLVCDDYGFATCTGATKAIDDFLRDKPEKMIALAAGAGFFIKGTPIAILAGRAVGG